MRFLLQFFEKRQIAGNDTHRWCVDAAGTAKVVHGDGGSGKR